MIIETYKPPNRNPPPCIYTQIYDVIRALVVLKKAGRAYPDGFSVASTVYTDGNITAQAAVFPAQFLGFHGRVFRVVIKTVRSLRTKTNCFNFKLKANI